MCILNWALCHSPPPDICPFSLAQQSFLGLSLPPHLVNVSPTLYQCPVLSHTIFVSLQCPFTGSPFVDFKSAMGLLWFLRPWVFIRPCFCLVLSFPLYFCRAWATIDGEVASFLILTPSTSSVTVDRYVHSVIKFKRSPQFSHLMSFCSCFQHMRNSALMQLLGSFQVCHIARYVGWMGVCFKNSFTGGSQVVQLVRGQCS